MLTDDEFLTAAKMLTERYISERMQQGRKIGLDIDAEGRIINQQVQLRAAKVKDEWVIIAEDWPQGTAAHDPDETMAELKVMSAVYRTIREMYSRVRIPRYPLQTLRFDVAGNVGTLLRTN